MLYELRIRSSVKKILDKLAQVDKDRITEKIILLGDNPDNPSLDIVHLQGHTDYYRLRVGKWRIIFIRDDEIKIIEIEKLKTRGDIYK